MPLDTYGALMAGSKTDASVRVADLLVGRMTSQSAPMPPRGLLAESDVDLVARWLAAGAEDDASCGDQATTAPSPAPWPDHCDETVRIVAHAPDSADAPYVVPAGQEIHPKVPVDAPWGDAEVQAIAFRPILSNAKVLHHWILYASDRTFLTGWAPGGDGGARLPDDVGMYMPHGAGSMYLDMHYFNKLGASDEPDASGVEVCLLHKDNFRPNTATVFRGFNSIGGPDLVLAPAMTANHDETGTCQVQASTKVRLITSAPHAHRYATHMRFDVQRATGESVVLHDKAFRFEEQGSYPVSGVVELTSGDVVHTTCTYTNDTASNVRFGESTEDEMCFNFAVYYPMGALSCKGRALL
jgi:hypothetical protein